MIVIKTVPIRLSAREIAWGNLIAVRMDRKRAILILLNEPQFPPHYIHWGDIVMVDEGWNVIAKVDHIPSKNEWMVLDVAPVEMRDPTEDDIKRNEVLV